MVGRGLLVVPPHQRGPASLRVRDDRLIKAIPVNQRLARSLIDLYSAIVTVGRRAAKRPSVEIICQVLCVGIGGQNHLPSARQAEREE